MVLATSEATAEAALDTAFESIADIIVGAAEPGDKE